LPAGEGLEEVDIWVLLSMGRRGERANIQVMVISSPGRIVLEACVE